MTTEERYRAILLNHLPPEAVDWTYAYLDRYKVHFHITRGRRSKLGDYRWPQRNASSDERTVNKREHTFHEISVNGDLNPYLFLWVLLHEAAHLETHLKYSNVAAHGHEWQGEYARLLAEHAVWFPPEVRPLVARYASRVPLYRPLLRQIEELLHRYDKDYVEGAVVHLDDLPVGSRFRLKSKPELVFESLEHRRTRWLCREVDTGRQYTVAGRAEVLPE